MLVAENDEIITLSSIVRDDVVVHREWTATKQTSLRGGVGFLRFARNRRSNLVFLAIQDLNQGIHPCDFFQSLVSVVRKKI